MAGEHKCPLCPATFTRPQHVGRHLRAHTGDRPYECKECPLRFARSDLLSRHVNKAHRTPEPGETKKEGKKGRRKSMPSSVRKPDLLDNSAIGGDRVVPAGQQSDAEGGTQGRVTAEAKERARRASFDQAPAPQLQAQRMYPNHPLLAGTPPPMSWNAPGVNGLVQSPVNTFNNAMLGTPTSAGFHPGLASPVRWPGADLNGASSAMLRNESGYASSGYDYGIKKRACDQCNHSKVRCDFAHPCTRCSHRNVHCSYNKPPKSRTLPITPGMSYPMTAMPSGASLSPVSHFSSSPHSMGSPLVQQSYQTQLPQQHLVNSQSPIRNWSNGLPNQATTSSTHGGQWLDGGGYDGTGPILPSTMDNGQALGMYMPQPAPHHPPPSAGISVPITQQFLGQLQNADGSNPSPPQAMLPTPSLTSHTTSPSSSDEPAERKFSLIGSMTALPLPGPIKSDSFNSTTSSNPMKSFSPPTKPEALPLMPMPEQSAATSLYHWPTSAFTMDPRYQFRNTAAPNQSDDEDGLNPHSSSASVYNDPQDDSAIVMDARRRSSAGLWASAFNSMSLHDGGLPNSAATVPDPYTAVQVAQHITQPRPHFPMASLAESNEPTKMPSLSDVKDVWKLFMQDPQPGAGMTPMQEKREGEVGMAMITPRPGLNRSLSKSSSMPDLTSPSLLSNQLYLLNGNGGTETLPQHPPGTVGQQGHPGANDDVTRQNWQTQISQRQASFNMQPGAKFGRNSADASGSNSAMLPPPIYGRPMASIIQHSGALQQTLAPERAPSFGLTPNAEKPNPTNTQLAGMGTWSRTPSKLSQRTTVTSATARPGNKRLPSQTLVPEAKKRSASFSIWDEGDDGALGDTEDDAQARNGQYSFQMPYPVMGGGGGAGGGSHSRSASLGQNHGFDMSMFINQPSLQQISNMGVSGQYGGMGMAPPGNWATTTAGMGDHKAI